jgi:hypothetical protein
MTPGSRLRQASWIATLLVCSALFVALTLRVNAVKSEVRLAERRIVSLEQEKMLLETEFETRANQQQLSAWNNVDFGYRAPGADQFLETERQLAALGTPRPKGAPQPIRVAGASTGDGERPFPVMVSPITGNPVAIGKLAQAEIGRERTGAHTVGMRSGPARIALSAPYGIAE